MAENCLVDDCQKRSLIADRDALVKALEEEREYWAGKVASAMIHFLPSDHSQDRVDRINAVLAGLGGSKP